MTKKKRKRTTTAERWANYVQQNGSERLTPRQRRRLRHKARTPAEVKFLAAL